MQPNGIVDLSTLKHKTPTADQQRFLDGLEKIVGIVVKPGDKVLLLLPPAAQTQDVQQFSQFLGEQFPLAQWIVIAGPTHLAHYQEPQGGMNPLPLQDVE